MLVLVMVITNFGSSFSLTRAPEQLIFVLGCFSLVPNVAGPRSPHILRCWQTNSIVSGLSWTSNCGRNDVWYIKAAPSFFSWFYQTKTMKNFCKTPFSLGFSLCFSLFPGFFRHKNLKPPTRRHLSRGEAAHRRGAGGAPQEPRGGAGRGHQSSPGFCWRFCFSFSRFFYGFLCFFLGFSEFF